MSSPVADLDLLYAQGRQFLDRGDMGGGLTRLQQAAHAGHAEAAHHIAMTVAAETPQGDSWDYVLAYVGRAAKAGHKRAQATLAFLAGDTEALAAVRDGAALPSDVWHRLHDAIRLETWLAPRPKTVAREAPLVQTIEGLIPPQMCDWIMAEAKPRLQRAMVYDPTRGNGTASNNRTNSDMRFSFPDVDLALMLAAHQIRAAVGCHFLDFEDPSVLHYTPGQEFRLHYDYITPFNIDIPVQGQRFWTLLIYLNEDYDGGETVFPRLDYKFKGRKGDALLFRNVNERGKPDPLTLHAGIATTRGEKWVFSQWIREPMDWTGARPIRVKFTPGS